MSDQNENKDQETPSTKKTWWNRICSAVVGAVIGVASMFGVTKTQVNTVQTDINQAYSDVQAIIQAVKEGNYSDAISKGKVALESIKKAGADVKDTVDTAKAGYEEYKPYIEAAKQHAAEKKWIEMASDISEIVKIINQKWPKDDAEKLTKNLDAIKTNLKDGKNTDEAVTEFNKIAAEQLVNSAVSK